MKKDNLIKIVIISALILLFLILIFIWLLSRSKQNQPTSFGPTPTLSVLQRTQKTPGSASNNNAGSRTDNTNQSSKNNNSQSNNQLNPSSTSPPSGSTTNNDTSTAKYSSISVLGNQYQEKNHSDYLSPELKKQEAEIQSNLQELFPENTNSTSDNQTGVQDGRKQINALINFFDSFFSLSNIDLSKIDPNPVFVTLVPTPPIVALPPLSPGLLNGKIGIYILSDYSPGAKQIVFSKPRILKVMDPQSNNTLQAIKDYKGINPQGITVLRAYIGTSGTKFNLENDPEIAAASFFQAVAQPALSALGENIKLFDFIETPNELDNTPGWESVENTTWLNRFWIKLAELYATNGLRTCVASIPVGNPPGDYAQMKAELAPFLPALLKVKELGGAFCYHAYTLNYSTDAAQELYTSLRYRQIHQAISELDNSLSSLPFILSEAGVDKNGDPKTSGWKARGNESDYTNWLSWFNGQINQDSYVLGATLYQIGDNHWSSFNIESIASWISKSL